MTQSTIFVGLGRVLGNEGDGRPRVRCMDATGTVTVADWALPYRYVAATGDVLLLLGQRGRYWVTGVVHGQGRSHLAFQGDAALRAAGTLRLHSHAGVRVRGPQVELRAEAVEASAGTIVQRLGELQTVVRDAFDERAGQCSRMIDGEDVRTADRHETLARHAVKIDGALLQLG